MTPDSDSGHGDLDERVRRLLDRADEQVDSLARGDDPDEDVLDAFDEIATSANELVSEADATDLLEVATPGELSTEGAEERPETIPEAIAESDPEAVVTLRKLLTLSRMDEADDEGALADAVEEFRELSEAPENVPDADEETETEEDGEEHGEASQEAAQESPDSGASDTGSKPDAEPDRGEQLRETLQEGIDEFREGLEEVRAGAAAESEANEDDETNEDEADEDDEPDTTDRSERGDGTMFSTIPSSDRADMRRTTRFSTVRNG